MLRRPPRSTRTDTPFPFTTLFRSGREALEVVGTQRVDQGIGLHAVTADERLEEAVLQRLAQDAHAGAVPIVDEHQRIGTPASELGALRAVGGLAVPVCGEAGDLAALGLELPAEGIGDTLAVVVVPIAPRPTPCPVGQQLAGQRLALEADRGGRRDP